MGVMIVNIEKMEKIRVPVNKIHFLDFRSAKTPVTTIETADVSMKMDEITPICDTNASSVLPKKSRSSGFKIGPDKFALAVENNSIKKKMKIVKTPATWEILLRFIIPTRSYFVVLGVSQFIYDFI